jgi:hypothetical protein
MDEIHHVDEGGMYIQNSSIGRKIKNTNEIHQLNVNLTNWVELMTYEFENFLWTKLKTWTYFDYMDDVGTT